jgi:ferredoxin
VWPAASCREGVCGTCETAVFAGDIDHRDSVLSNAEKKAGRSMMICVSRARSAKLVLDL